MQFHIIYLHLLTVMYPTVFEAEQAVSWQVSKEIEYIERYTFLLQNCIT